jgi:hypothetical protein
LTTAAGVSPTEAPCSTSSSHYDQRCQKTHIDIKIIIQKTEPPTDYSNRKYRKLQLSHEFIAKIGLPTGFKLYLDKWIN